MGSIIGYFKIHKAMRRAIYVILFALISGYGYGQKVKVSLYTGYGSYRMSDIKTFQSAMVKEVGFDVKKVSAFPPFYNYSLSGEYGISNLEMIGINFAFLSTGGRNSRIDYSGEYRLDMPIKAMLIGTQYRRFFVISNNLNLYGQLRSGAVYTKLELSESLEIYNSGKIENAYDFEGYGFFAEPSIGLTYDVSERISLDICCGYQYDHGSKFRNTKNDDVVLRSPYGNAVHSNWSGFRGAVGLTFSILK